MWRQFFFFSSRRRHTRSTRDWSSDVCSSDLVSSHAAPELAVIRGQVKSEPSGWEEVGWAKAAPKLEAEKATVAADKPAVQSPKTASAIPPWSKKQRHENLDKVPEGFLEAQAAEGPKDAKAAEQA